MTYIVVPLSDCDHFFSQKFDIFLFSVSSKWPCKMITYDFAEAHWMMFRFIWGKKNSLWALWQPCIPFLCVFQEAGKTQGKDVQFSCSMEQLQVNFTGTICIRKIKGAFCYNPMFSISGMYSTIYTSTSDWWKIKVVCGEMNSFSAPSKCVKRFATKGACRPQENSMFSRWRKVRMLYSSGRQNR